MAAAFRLWEAVISQLYQYAERLGLVRYAWVGAERLRPLLGESPARLSPRQRLQRRMLMLFLALPDSFYRRAFMALGRKIALAGATGDVVRPRTGMLMMIGGLGAGGSERQLVLMLRELKSRGAPPLALAWFSPSAPEARFFLPELEAACIPVCTIGDAPAGVVPSELTEAIYGMPEDLHPVRDYAATFAATRPAIAHLWLDEVNTRGGIAAVVTGVPRVILSLRSMPPDNFVFHHPYMREAYRWLARQPGVSLVNNSRSGARAYEAWLGLPGGSIGFIYNGFRFDAGVLNGYRDGRGRYRALTGIPHDSPLVGGVFRLSEEKRPLLWLEIAAAVRRVLPQARFLVVGGGPLRDEMDRRAQAPDLAGAVHFAGYERDVLGVIADLDVLLLTSRLEGLPNVLVEAQALGVPVVTMKGGGAPETVIDGVTGVVLQDDDIERAAAALVKVLLDTEWRREAAQRAPAFVDGAFGVERTIDAFIGLYGKFWTG